MTSRVSSAQLQSIVDRINTMTGSPMRPYDITEDGSKFVAQVGCFHLGQAYGGYALHRMSNTSGGVSDVLSGGHMPKRELAELMYAFIRGMEQTKD